MADESVTFEVKLKDLTSGPAGRAAVNLQKVGVAGDVLGSKMASLAKAFGLAYAAKQVFDGAMAAGGYLMGAARDASQLSFALGQLTHGDGRRAMAEIGSLAASLGLDAKETAHQFEKMLKLQFSQEESKTWVRLGADMQALGNSAEDVQGILTAIGQIRSKGRLQGEEMLQLAERGVSQSLVNEEIAKRMGVDTRAVQGLQQAGKVTAEVALDSIQSALLRKLKTDKPGEAAAKYVATSFAGQLAKTEGEMSLLRLAMGGSFERGFAGSGGLQLLTNMLGDKGTLDTIDSLATGFGKIAGVVGEVVAVFSEGFLTVLGEFTDSSGKAGLGATDFVGAIRAALPVVRVLGGMLAIVVSAVMNIFSALGLAADGFATLFDLDQLTMIGRFLIDGLVGGIKAGLASLKELIFGMGASVIGWLRSALGIRSPSKEMAYLGEMSAEGYQRGLDSLSPTMGSAVPTMSSESAAYGAGKGSASMAGSVAVGGVTINVTSQDPQTAGQSVMREFEARFASLIGTYALGAGA